MRHPPEFDLVQHAFGLLMGHTYQGLLVDGNELISRPQTSILHNEKTEEQAPDCLLISLKFLLFLFNSS